MSWRFLLFPCTCCMKKSRTPFCVFLFAPSNSLPEGHPVFCLVFRSERPFLLSVCHFTHFNWMPVLDFFFDFRFPLFLWWRFLAHSHLYLSKGVPDTRQTTNQDIVADEAQFPKLSVSFCPHFRKKPHNIKNKHSSQQLGSLQKLEQITAKSVCHL